MVLICPGSVLDFISTKAVFSPEFILYFIILFYYILLFIILLFKFFQATERRSEISARRSATGAVVWGEHCKG